MSLQSVRRSAVAGVVALATVQIVGVLSGAQASAQIDDPGFAGGAVQEVNASGAWSWFEGPRAVLTDCELLVGSVARSGSVEVSSTPHATGASRVDRIGGMAERDDHNSPGLVEIPGGKVLASWSRHHRDTVVRNVERPSGMWNWFEGTTIQATEPTTYANLVHLDDEGPNGRLYDFFRADGWNSVFSFSDDQGRRWSEPTALIRKYAHRPYTIYDDDGVRRIDIATTEGHPREFTTGTGVFHGYVEGGFLRRSNGAVVATADYGVAPEELTRVYQQTPDERAWVLDVVSPTDARAATIVISVRDLSESTPEHRRNRYLYASFNGTGWDVHPLAWAGNSLYQVEEFYTGGVAIDPADPSHVVLATDVDPATGVPLPAADGRTEAAFELYDGFTNDGGQTWTFEPITALSAESNLRPVIPDPTDDTRALVWMQGRYSSYLSWSTRMLAIVDSDDPAPCPEPLETYAADPFAGDFDGDGVLDWFHYQPGSAPDTIHWGDGDTTTVTVNGTYDPQVRRVSDGSDQILWASPTVSYTWIEDEHAFASVRIPHSTGVRLLAGDFDGDDVDDLFHYRPGTGTDRIYWSDGTSTAVRVNGTYQPLTGDFTGDGIDDLLWYGPGSTLDYYWRFRTDHTWASYRTNISGQYLPAVGDIDQNGVDDVFWRRSSGGGYQWLHRAGSTPSKADIALP